MSKYIIMSYKEKYLKYKVKYQHLLNSQEGGRFDENENKYIIGVGVNQKIYNIGQRITINMIDLKDSSKNKIVTVVKPPSGEDARETFIFA